MTIFKHFPKYSYSKFLFNNPNACKKQKIKALNLFLNSTRCTKNTKLESIEDSDIQIIFGNNQRSKMKSLINNLNYHSSFY